MDITTLFDIGDAVYFKDPERRERSGAVVGIDVRVGSESVGGVYQALTPAIQYQVFVDDGVDVAEFVTKWEADLTGTAPPPPPGP